MKRDLRFRNCFKALVVMVFFGIGNLGFGQIVFSENVGTATSGNTSIASTVFQNSSTLSYVGDADTRITTPSSGYTGSSAGRNVFVTNSVGRYFTIYNIDSYNYNNLILSFGLQKSTTATTILTSTQFVVEVATDYNSTNNTGTFTQLSFSNISTNSTTWSLVNCTGTIPSSSTLAIRFRQNSTTHQIRIDDIKLSGALTATLWNGSTSNIWSEATNWTPNVVPTGAEDVLISSGTPILDQNYTIATGKKLTINGTGTLTVSSTNTLTVAGTAAFNDKNIIFKSDSNGTASFGAVTGTVTGATNVTVERFISGRRAFRFLSPGVTTTTSIFDNWQNGGLSTAGIGTHITGGASNGFDPTGTNNPSLHTYNAQATGTTTGFTAAANTNVATLKAGVGYRLLVRGDRNVDLTVASSDNMNVATVLSAKGVLTIGSVAFDSTAGSPAPVNNNAANTQTDGFTLIGNPYVSSVDWDLVTKTGVSNDAYYSWDPTLGTATQRGRYVVYVPGVGTNLYGGSALAQANRKYLQSGQAVFIKNTDLAVPATVTFNESNKASVYSYVFRSSQQALTTVGNSALFLTAYEPNELALGGSPIDGAVALFGSNFSNSLNAQDVDKLSSSGENLAFVRENKNLAIETLAPVATDDVLFVKTLQFQADKSYTFKVNTENFDTTVSAKLVDLYLNTETSLDLTQPSFVNFATTSDANSYASDRFKIVFNSAALGTGTFTGSAIAVYPNPITNSQFSIALPSNVSGKVTVSMSNMLGQVVYNETSEANSTMLIAPRQQLQEGVYIVSVSNNGKVMQSKVVVRN